MIRVGADGDLEALVGERLVTDGNGHKTHVVVDFGQVQPISILNRSLETVECHVVLGRVEGAKTQIVPNLAVVDAALYETPVEAHSYLGLISVEMVACNGCDGLNVVVVEREHLFV